MRLLNTAAFTIILLAVSPPSLSQGFAYLGYGAGDSHNESIGGVAFNGELGYSTDSDYTVSLDSFYIYRAGYTLFGEEDDLRGLASYNALIGKRYSYGKNSFRFGVGASLSGYDVSSQDSYEYDAGLAASIGYNYMFTPGFGIGAKYNFIGNSSDRYSVATVNLAFNF